LGTPNRIAVPPGGASGDRLVESARHFPADLATHLSAGGIPLEGACGTPPHLDILVLRFIGEQQSYSEVQQFGVLCQERLDQRRIHIVGALGCQNSESAPGEGGLMAPVRFAASVSAS
jgi:hypothetical protein